MQMIRRMMGIHDLEEVFGDIHSQSSALLHQRLVNGLGAGRGAARHDAGDLHAVDGDGGFGSGNDVVVTAVQGQRGRVGGASQRRANVVGARGWDHQER